MSLSELIRERIRAQGHLTLADYMELCLNHSEYGYYRQRDPFGVKGDFTTAPEISQIFGELAGAWIAAQWQAQGCPQAQLVELGPGRGTLMRDVLRATKQVPGFHAALKVAMVETSPTLCAAQQKLLTVVENIEWHSTLDAALQQNCPLFLIANEFFDALPIRQFVWREEWLEKVVVEREGTLAFDFVIPHLSRDLKPERDALTFSVSPRSQHEAGMTIEVNEAAEEITECIAQHIAACGGAALVVDYGYAQGSGDTFQAMRSHRFVDPLEMPGEADLTAHVDFAALVRAAEGVQIAGPVGQGEWLRCLGAELRLAQLTRQATMEQKAAMVAGLERLMMPDQMGELFKVMAMVPKHVPQPEGFTYASRSPEIRRRR